MNTLTKREGIQYYKFWASILAKPVPGHIQVAKSMIVTALGKPVHQYPGKPEKNK